MFLVLLSLLLTVVFLLCLFRDRQEEYRLFSELGKEVVKEGKTLEQIIAKKMSSLSLKYGPHSDYSTFHQRRARGQIRDTGEDH